MKRSRRITRRRFLESVGVAASAVAVGHPSLAAEAPGAQRPQRVCVVLLDGFGIDYFEQCPMPTLKRWAKDGFFKRIKGVMPAVTNTNVTGVCCGVHAEEHGITGNSYWDAEADQERFMSDGSLLTATTLFQRAGRFGVESALLSAKQKTIPLLSRGTTLAIGAQDPPAALLKKHGRPPDIYSADVNYWVWTVAVDLIKNHPKLGLFFIHTTDYPMHMHPPESGEMRAYLSKTDDFLKAAAEADPNMAFFVTADHGMNFKSVVVNLNRALSVRKADVKRVISAERDQYPRHHSGYGGTAFVYLNSPDDAPKTMEALRGIDGVEEVLTRAEASRKYRLNPHRLGDLWVTARRDVVFGDSAKEREPLAKAYRSHGSAHELDIPCFIYRFAGKLPEPNELTTNMDVCRFLYRT